MSASTQVVERIRCKFAETGQPTEIPLLKGKCFEAELTESGVTVSNLGDQSFLPWAVFEEAVNLMERNGGRALRGDAMKASLGQADLPLDSIEGHVAVVVYGRQRGDSVFRRVTPIACLLIWAGICQARPGELVLMPA